MSLPKMNPKYKKLWVEALRSGEYEQGRMRLKSPDGTYCCLGVLCAVGHGKSPLTTSIYLRPEDLNKFGLQEEVQAKLAEFNDVRGYSFQWIAAYIERYL